MQRYFALAFSLSLSLCTWLSTASYLFICNTITYLQLHFCLCNLLSSSVDSRLSKFLAAFVCSVIITYSKFTFRKQSQSFQPQRQCLKFSSNFLVLHILCPFVFSKFFVKTTVFTSISSSVTILSNNQCDIKD